MSLGGYRASLRAGSKSILMLETESHNSADLQWSGVSNIILSTMETPQVKCRYVCVCMHTQNIPALTFPLSFGLQSTVCVYDPVRPFTGVVSAFARPHWTVSTVGAREKSSHFAL